MFKALSSSLLSLLAFSVHANSIISITLDNDGIVGTDKDYSNGLFVESHTELDHSPVEWLKNDEARYYLGLSLGQKIWTPREIEREEPQPNDRPYAGLSYLTFSLTSRTASQLQSVEMMLGTMGENSFASQSQRIIHRLIGSPTPNGWAHQVEEPWVWGVNYHRNDVLFRSQTQDQQHELTWINRAQIGNFRPEVGSGLLYRYGPQLADSFASTQIRYAQPNQTLYASKGQSGYYYFTGVEIRARYQDITLSGETPSNTPTMSIQHQQATAIIGLAGYHNSLGIALSFMAKTPDYQEDPHRMHAAGSLSLFWLL